jgi:hypothetical protein
MKKFFTILGMLGIVSVANAQIVINEVYGAGGNSGAVYINDFVELINSGTSTATITGASLQYASATGTFNSYVTLPSITLSAGQKFLIEMIPSTAGTNGAPLPTADFQASSNTSFSNGQVYNGGFSMAAGAGKIVLVSNLSQVVNATDSNVLDFVGYGTTANKYEGSAAAPAPSTTLSISRTNGIDTNNNAADFTASAPTPQNMGSALATLEAGKGKNSLVQNTYVKSEINFGADAKNVKVYSMYGQVVREISVKNNQTVNVSDLPKGTYIVTGTVNNNPVSQKILKD